MKTTTICEVVAAFLEKEKPMLANEAAIYYKTLAICEERGVDEAMAYYMGWHSEDEYKEFEPKALIAGFLARVKNLRLRTTNGR